MSTVAGQAGSGGGAIRPVVAGLGGRRRRPSGEPPPLPRHVDRTTRAYLALVVLAGLIWAGLVVQPVARVLIAGDSAVLRGVSALRADSLTHVLRQVEHLDSTWTLRLLGWGTLVVLLLVRRFAHVAAYLVATLTAVLIGSGAAVVVGRFRPPGIETAGSWSGYACPSLPVLRLAVVCAGVVYTLLPLGRPRQIGRMVVAVLLSIICLTRLYLGVDAPLDVFTGLVIGWGLPVAIFRTAVPDDVFPVSYASGNRAHLDVGGARGAAIARALESQLGLRLVGLEPFGLGGSAGSTPLQMRVRPASGPADTAERVVFAKLYAISHLRSDRWYKLSRTVLFGRLEDEKPFSGVRRLVEYEDHLLRLLRDARLPVPEPLGIVEITPEREYLIVMSFFERARDLGEAAVGPDSFDDDLIDDGLSIVRRLWDVGVAHRDIKPSNLLVRDNRVLMIDVAFGTVRPTPWRQAVDLANMMLTLALGSRPERVYERALRQFAADDIAEAFAASRSITVPTQLRSRVRADGRDLPACFRRLAPSRAPIQIQLWNLRRVGTSFGLLAAVALLLSATSAYVSVAPGGSGTVLAAPVPECATGTTRLGLVAQSVPSAAYLPCLQELPSGWSTQRFEVSSSGTTFLLVPDRDRRHPVSVRLLPACPPEAATSLPPRAPGVRTSVELASISPRYAGALYDSFAGGCVRYDFDFARGAHIGLVAEFEAATGLLPRRELRLRLRQELGVRLDP